MSPAVGHVSESAAHLWNRHIRPKADARYVGSQEVLWAFVEGNGTLARGNGATAAETTTFPSQYLVTFNRDVSACAWIATRATALESSGEIATAAGSDPNTVLVDIHNSTGLEGAAVPFSLAVMC